MNAMEETTLPVWRHRWLARSPVLGYALVAYVFTWGLSLPLLAARRGWIDASPGEGWEALAAFGPPALPGAHGSSGPAVAYADGGGNCPDGPFPPPDPNGACGAPTPTPTPKP